MSIAGRGGGADMSASIRVQSFEGRKVLVWFCCARALLSARDQLFRERPRTDEWDEAFEELSLLLFVYFVSWLSMSFPVCPSILSALCAALYAAPHLMSPEARSSSIPCYLPSLPCRHSACQPPCRCRCRS